MAIFDRRSKFSPNRAFTKVIWGERSKVLEVELEEFQDIMKYQLEQFSRLTFGEGFFYLEELSYSGGVLTVPPDAIYVEGFLSEFTEPMTLTVGNNNTVYLAVERVMVDHNDILRKDGNQSGGSIITNDLVDSRIGFETSRREQIQLTLTTNNADANLVYLPVCSINASGQVTDLRGEMRRSEVDSVNGKSGHVVLTKDDVGLGNVANYAPASQLEAEAGAINNRTMSPLRVKQAIDSLSPVKSVAGKTGVVALTKDDVDLGNVANYAPATQLEAEAGAINNRTMSPLRVKQAIDSLSPVKSVAGKTGAVTLAKGDVGLGNAPNYAPATQAEAEAGTANDKLMTPLRTKQAIDNLIPANIATTDTAQTLENKTLVNPTINKMTMGNFTIEFNSVLDSIDIGRV